MKKFEISLIIAVFGLGIAVGHFATSTAIYKLAGDIYFDPNDCNEDTTIRNGVAKSNWSVEDTTGTFYMANWSNSQTCAELLNKFKVTK